MNPPTSFRSIRSNKSRKSNITSSDPEEDFEICLMELSKRYNCPVAVRVSKEYQHRDNRNQKKPEANSKHKQSRFALSDSRFDLNASDLATNLPILLTITAIYDAQNHLSEIHIAEFQQHIIPRITIKLLALILSNFRQLNKVTIKNCRIDMFVVHELSKGLPFSTITDVCLDDCPLIEANYEALLKNPSFLKHLSLCRCKINDAVCQRIASKLHFLESAEKNLVTLNLTSNCIGDEGAKYIAEALRSNRCLRYLNLADNLISDEGATLIFGKFMEFPLTYDENIDRRHRLLLYFKKKSEIYAECLHKLGYPQKSPAGSITNRTKAVPPKRVSTAKRRSIHKRESTKSISLNLNQDNIAMKAELITRELVGPFVDPFCDSSVKIKDCYPYCIGNFVLCYLNIAYNELTYASVKSLLSVVEYQKTCHDTVCACGLMKVILDGNYLPVKCPELTTIQKILNKHVACVSKSKLLKGIP